MTDFGNMSSDVSSVTTLPDELRVAAGPGAVPTGSGKLILVVDDEDDIRRLLKRVLEGKGFRVMEADRGQLALRMVKEHVPDLIVLDAMLPELHGFDIARRIKGSEKYGSIPIIMVSAIYKGKIADDLKANYGIEEYLEKPFRIGEVVSAIQRLLAARAAVPVNPAKHNTEELSADAEEALNSGIAAYKAGNIDIAIEHLQRGILIDPLAYRLHYHLALLYGKRGNVFEGISELEKAIDLNPRHFPALKNLGVLYEKGGFRQKATEIWERAVGAAPDEETKASIREHIKELKS